MFCHNASGIQLKAINRLQEQLDLRYQFLCGLGNLLRALRILVDKGGDIVGCIENLLQSGRLVRRRLPDLRSHFIYVSNGLINLHRTGFLFIGRRMYFVPFLIIVIVFCERFEISLTTPAY